MEANWAVLVVVEEDGMVVVGERVAVNDGRMLLILAPPLRLPPPPPGNRVGVVNANEFVPRRARSSSRAATRNEPNAPKAVWMRRRLLPPVTVMVISCHIMRVILILYS